MAAAPVAFPLVWTPLYVTIAYGTGRMVDKAAPEERRSLLGLSAADLVTNAGWNWAFFRGRSPAGGLTVRLALALTIASVVLGGCGSTYGLDPTPHSDVTAAGASVALVDEAEADLVLIVSNQSFDDERVRLTIAIDGVTVVDDDFHVEDQHTWVSFPLSLPPGGHEVVAESDSGATLREPFEVPRDSKRYAIIDHWTEDDSAGTDDPSVRLTWELLDRPPAFQ